MAAMRGMTMLAAVPVPPEGPALLAWSFEPVTVAALLALGSGYAAGLVRLQRRGIPHRAAAVTAWWAGLAVLVVALVSPIDRYSGVSFAVHMMQHVLLTLVAPPLLALGAPATLALRALSPGPARRVARALGSRPVAFVTHPVVALALFAGVPWVVHFSPMFDLALRSDAWHAVEHAVWVGAALLVWWPAIGADPTPHPWSHPVRLLVLFLTMPATAFLSLALFAATEPLAPTYAAVAPPWGPGALASQRDAAVVMWLSSALLIVPAMLIVAVAWKRHDDAVQRRREARLDADRAARSTA
jgi:cytochrome c oxidase assembly factor CtaG